MSGFQIPKGTVLVISVAVAIDVTRGGEELGRGFCLGENVTLSASLSRGKFGANSMVIKFEIDNSSYVSLNTRVLNRRQYVY